MCKAFEEYENRMDATWMMHDAITSLAGVRVRIEEPDMEMSKEELARCDTFLEGAVFSACGSIFTFEEEPEEYFGRAEDRAVLFNSKYSGVFGKVPVKFSGHSVLPSVGKEDIVNKYNAVTVWLTGLLAKVQDKLCTHCLYV